MTAIQLLACAGMIVGVFLLLGMKPVEFTDSLFGFLLNPKRSLREDIRESSGRKKSGILRRELKEAQNILQMTGRGNRFSFICAVALALFCAGGSIAILLGNFFLAPVMAVGFLFLPFWYVKLTANHYKRDVSAELETALSIITTNYVSNDDIIYAVEQSIDYINPPVQQAFRKFLTQTKLINSNVKLAIEQLKGEINNEIFHEWCDSLIECQDNVTLKKTLQPITTKLSNVRIINAELRNMLMSPRREHVMMVFILLANYPILYFLNSDWFKVLTDTFVGQVVNSIVAIVVIITVILAYKYTQPIQYKR